jgi:hypothetical protein
MTWGAVAAIGGAVIGGVAANSAAKEQAGAAKDAAATQASAANRATALQREQFDLTRADQAPYRQTGVGALNQLSLLMGLPSGAQGSQGGYGGPKTYSSADLLVGPEMRPNEDLYAKDPEYRKAYDSIQKSISYVTAGGTLSDPVRYEKYAGNVLPKLQKLINLDQINQRMKGIQDQERAAQPDPRSSPDFGSLTKRFGMADYEADPGYAFRRDEGQKGIERFAASKGGLLSGAALKGIERFGQGLASQEYGAAFDRYNTQNNQQFNRLASLAGVGQTANQQIAAAGQQFANAAGGLGMQGAAAQGNAMLAGGQARASGYAGIGNALSGAVQNWPQQQQSGYQIPQGYNMGSGYLGNSFATSQGYQPLDHATANAGYYD